jgi:hypothetical protein
MKYTIHMVNGSSYVFTGDDAEKIKKLVIDAFSKNKRLLTIEIMVGSEKQGKTTFVMNNISFMEEHLNG